jgi:hypothetical protein
MPLLPTHLYKDATGGHPLGDVLNIAKKCIRERTPLDGQDIGVDPTPDGYRLFLKERIAASSAAKLSLYSVKSVWADILICNEYDPDGTVGTEDVNVAKPFNIQRRTWAKSTVDGSGFWTWGTSDEIDGATYAPVSRGNTGPNTTNFVNMDQNPFVRRVKTQVTAPSWYIGEGTEQHIANVAWVEMVYPEYVIAGRGNVTGVGDIIVAFDLEEPITLPATSYQFGGASSSTDEMTITKMEVPWRHWVPIQRPIIICEQVGDSVLQRRVMIRASDSFPLT